MAAYPSVLHPPARPARDEPCWTRSLVLREPIVMIRFPAILLSLVAAAGCQKNNDSDAPSRHLETPNPAPSSIPAPGGPNTPPQSNEELRAPLAKIDDVTITLGEFQ